MRHFDEATVDCRISVGTDPEWTLWRRCRTASMTTSFVAGALQFGVPAIAFLLWRQRR
jgi:hypothetical protein